MSWFSNSSFQVLWESILCFMFPYWNLTTYLPFQEEFMIPLPLLKPMVNMNIIWKTFGTQGFLIVNSNILFINMDMMWISTLGNQSKIYPTPWRKFTSFINDTQASPSPLFMELVIKRGGDVMEANAMEFIHTIVDPSLVLNFYLTFNLVLARF